MSEIPKVKRIPVMLHPDTVACINIYRRPSVDFIEEDFGYFWESTGNDDYTYEEDAKNFVDQIGDHMCIAMMKEVVKNFQKIIDEHSERVKGI